MKQFKYLLKLINLNFLNNSPTRNGNCLGNVFVNSEVLTCNVIAFPYSDHDAIIAKMNVKLKVKLVTGRSSDRIDDNFKLILPT